MPYRYQIGGLIVLLLAVVLASVVYGSDKRWTFEEALRQSAGHPSTAFMPKVPDDVELAFWQCVASAYVRTQIGAEELAVLDAQVNSGDLTQEPIRTRLERWKDYLRTSGPTDPVTQEIDRYASQSECADDYNAFFRYYRS